ncbi:hypothetical protein A9K55_006471 [Cordyceps militaris]|uniref:Uncharacterized protein n=1 Tax=Cordyceps militaris TaxID=73501 RepID=A0A2H4SAR5_CORMI|nr:hypothetical protein A9K55_006471 [Cordyceps militaris]
MTIATSAPPESVGVDPFSFSGFLYVEFDKYAFPLRRLARPDGEPLRFDFTVAFEESTFSITPHPVSFPADVPPARFMEQGNHISAMDQCTIFLSMTLPGRRWPRVPCSREAMQSLATNHRNRRRRRRTARATPRELEKPGIMEPTTD